MNSNFNDFLFSTLMIDQFLFCEMSIISVALRVRILNYGAALL